MGTKIKQPVRQSIKYVKQPPFSSSIHTSNCFVLMRCQKLQITWYTFLFSATKHVFLWGGGGKQWYKLKQLFICINSVLHYVTKDKITNTAQNCTPQHTVYAHCTLSLHIHLPLKWTYNFVLRQQKHIHNV